jgi:transcriptional regulator with XRE-family HTH domain
MLERDDFGGRIERLRLLGGLTARELDRLAGLQPGHVRHIERGLRKHVSADTIAGIADVFGVSSDLLFRGIGTMPDRAEVCAGIARSRKRLRKAS